MSLLQELMALRATVTERYDYDDHDDYDPSDDADDGERSFIIREYDGCQPEDMIIDLFDLEVTYTLHDEGYTDHPYGEGSAREYHGMSTDDVEAVAAEEVICRDPDTDEIVKRLPKGTKLEDIPGFTNDQWDYIQQQVDRHGG
jgi:hypothetical protein